MACEQSPLQPQIFFPWEQSPTQPQALLVHPHEPTQPHDKLFPHSQAPSHVPHEEESRSAVIRASRTALRAATFDDDVKTPVTQSD